MAVPVARLYNRLTACASFGKPRPLIPVSTKRHVEFRFQEFLDEAANAGAHPGFQGIGAVRELVFPVPVRPSAAAS
jgi:hypothetical protein